MRATALKLFCAAALGAGFLPAQTEPLIAKLASALSRSDPAGAMQAFDSGMKDYAVVESDLIALAAQTEVLCAIDIVEDKVSGETHTLDVDWYMQLRSLASQGPTERRRERVTLRIERVKGKWKIVSLSPLAILAPIRID